MRKILSFLTAILFAGSMMATDVEVLIHASSGDFYAKTHEWVSGSNSGPAYDQVVLDEVITANRIGTGNNGKYYSDWRFYTNGSDEGSFSIDAAEGYELKSVTFTYTVSNSGALYMGETKLASKTPVEISGNKAVFQCKNTNTSTNGQVRLTAIAVTYDVAGGGEPQTYWTVAGSSATLFGTAWDPANKANDMVKQGDGSYKWEKTELELAAGEIAFKVCKDHAWTEAYPASDYKLPIAEAGIYTITITFEPENENTVSAVATKTGEAVVLPTVVLHGNFFGDWKDTDPFAPAEDKLTAELKLTLAEGAYDFGFKFDGAWKANGAQLTRENPTTSLAEGDGNMKITADQAGDYVFTYTFATEGLAVTYPKKQEVLPAGAYMLTFKGTGTDSDNSSEFKKDGDIFTDECKAYVASVDTISKVYAARIIDENTSNLKFGTSSVKGYLQFTLATPVEVDSIIVNAAQYGKNAAEVTVNGTKFDLTAGNKVPTDCKITPEGKVSAITIAQTGSERIYLRYITVYAKTSPTPPTPVTLPVVALAGGMNGWSADANILVAAKDSLSASVKVALEAGDVEFKIVSDGKWLSLNGEDPDGLYTFHRDWTTVSHVNVIDGRNFKLTADVAGDYIFTWTYADSTLAITFPAKPKPVLTDGYYLMGSFNDWKPAAENLLVANPDAEGEYQLDINLTAGDEIKVAYVVADAVTTWFPEEGNYIVDANHSGPTTMYFRPNYKDEWAAFGGYFYIVPTGSEGIEEILSEGKAVKVIREGNLIILKGDKAYNAMGQIVK